MTVCEKEGRKEKRESEARKAHNGAQLPARGGNARIHCDTDSD